MPLCSQNMGMQFKDEIHFTRPFIARPAFSFCLKWLQLPLVLLQNTCSSICYNKLICNFVILSILSLYWHKQLYDTSNDICHFTVLHTSIHFIPSTFKYHTITKIGRKQVICWDLNLQQWLILITVGRESSDWSSFSRVTKVSLKGKQNMLHLVLYNKTIKWTTNNRKVFFKKLCREFIPFPPSILSIPLKKELLFLPYLSSNSILIQWPQHSGFPWN